MKLVEQYDRLNAIEAHTVYRVNGRIICVIARNGQTLFERADDFRAAGGLKPSDEAGDLGFTGERYMDYVSRRIAANLAQRHADALDVAVFEEGDAPTLGDLREQMFGITRERLWAIAAGAALGFESKEFHQSILVFPRT
jgi:hypothetical protein